MPVSKKDRGVLLLPIVEDKATMKMSFAFAQLMIEENPLLSVRHFYPLTGEDMLNIGNRFYRRLKTFRYYGHFNTKRVMDMHNVTRSDLAFSNFSLFFWRNKKYRIPSKEALLDFKVGDIPAGDLIYDTYLRYKNRATVDINDKALQDIINYAHQLTARIERYLSRENVNAVILPYTTYVHWGLLTRIALRHNIPVYTFGNVSYLLQQATSAYPFHSKNYSLYRKLFNALENKMELVEQASDVLQKRLSGVVDVGIQYMRKSAFLSTGDSQKFQHNSDKPFAVIFAHCFFDSPHIYGDLLFPDFYEWMRFLLTVASAQKNVLYYVKPHPNGIDGNTEIIAELLREFDSPNIVLLNSSVSNIELINNHPNAIFSVYGTVCHEFAYMGIPAVLAGENPHGKYAFYYNPTTKSALEVFVKNVGSYGLPEGYNKKDIEEFFFMNYQYIAKGVYNLSMVKTKDFATGQLLLPENPTLANVVFA